MSPTAVTALGIVERQDRLEAAQAQVDNEVLAVRAALLTKSPEKANVLFPEYFLPTPEQAAQDLENRVEQDEPTPEDIDDIERWIAQQGGGTITGAELDPDEGWE